MMRIQNVSNTILLLLYLISSSCSLGVPKNKIAVIGTTGQVGRQIIQKLSSQNVPLKCLLRHPIDPSIPAPTSIDDTSTSQEVAAYFSNLPNVELVEGDVTQKESLEELMKDCSALMAVHGPKAYPFYKTLIPPLFSESDPTHSRMINYVGVRNILSVISENKDIRSSMKRVVRITGKGEDPYSFFSILINMFGSMAKGWNYEGEQLLRNADVDYTIIRPGIMGTSNVKTGKVLGLKDDGEDMKVTPVSHGQIADLCIGTLEYENCARSTLTAMNVDDGEGEEDYGVLLEKVRGDRREFPESLIEDHKKGARIGAGVLVVLSAVFVKVFLVILGKVLSFLF